MATKRTAIVTYTKCDNLEDALSHRVPRGGINYFTSNIEIKTLLLPSDSLMMATKTVEELEKLAEIFGYYFYFTDQRHKDEYVPKYWWFFNIHHYYEFSPDRC